MGRINKMNAKKSQYSRSRDKGYNYKIHNLNTGFEIYLESKIII